MKYITCSKGKSFVETALAYQDLESLTLLKLGLSISYQRVIPFLQPKTSSIIDILPLPLTTCTSAPPPNLLSPSHPIPPLSRPLSTLYLIHVS